MGLAKVARRHTRIIYTRASQKADDDDDLNPETDRAKNVRAGGFPSATKFNVFDYCQTLRSTRCDDDDGGRIRKAQAKRIGVRRRTVRRRPARHSSASSLCPHVVARILIMHKRARTCRHYDWRARARANSDDDDDKRETHFALTWLVRRRRASEDGKKRTKQKKKKGLITYAIVRRRRASTRRGGAVAARGQQERALKFHQAENWPYTPRVYIIIAVIITYIL